MYCAVRALLTSRVKTLFATVITEAALSETLSLADLAEQPLSDAIPTATPTIDFNIFFFI